MHMVVCSADNIFRNMHAQTRKEAATFEKLHHQAA